MNNKIKDNNPLSFYLPKGNYEILNNSSKVRQFKNIRDLINLKTSKKYSSAIIASSTKKLENKGATKNEVIKDKKKKSNRLRNIEDTKGNKKN